MADYDPELNYYGDDAMDVSGAAATHATQSSGTYNVLSETTTTTTTVFQHRAHTTVDNGGGAGLAQRGDGGGGAGQAQRGGDGGGGAGPAQRGDDDDCDGALWSSDYDATSDEEGDGSDSVDGVRCLACNVAFFSIVHRGASAPAFYADDEEETRPPLPEARACGLCGDAVCSARCALIVGMRAAHACGCTCCARCAVAERCPVCS